MDRHPLQTPDLTAGDIVDFAVGARGDFSFDSTGFNAAISLAPAVTISVPGAVDGKLTVTGADLVVTADILFENPATTLELRDNGKVVGRDDSEPYQFTIEDIESGRTRSRRWRSIRAASKARPRTLTDCGSPRLPGRWHGEVTREPELVRLLLPAPVTSSPNLPVTGQDPNNWTPAGVPGLNDDAYILGVGNAGSCLPSGQVEAAPDGRVGHTS